LDGLEASDVLAAIDVNFRAVDVARLVRAEEIDGLRHLRRGAKPAERHLGFNQLRRSGGEDGGVDLARRNGIGAHAARAEFMRQFPCQRRKRCLRGGIGHTGERMHARADNRGDINDGAFRGLQFRQKRAGEQCR